MSVIYIVLPLAILLASAALATFFWAISQHQFDDLDSPPYRMLFDDEQDHASQNAEKETSAKP